MWDTRKTGARLNSTTFFPRIINTFIEKSLDVISRCKIFRYHYINREYYIWSSLFIGCAPFIYHRLNLFYFFSYIFFIISTSISIFHEFLQNWESNPITIIFVVAVFTWEYSRVKVDWDLNSTPCYCLFVIKFSLLDTHKYPENIFSIGNIFGSR